MNQLKKAGLVIVALTSLSLLQSCEDGTFEEAGEEIDRVAADAADTTEDAVRETGNRVEDACEELTETNC